MSFAHRWSLRKSVYLYAFFYFFLVVTSQSGVAFFATMNVHPEHLGIHQIVDSRKQSQIKEIPGILELVLLKHKEQDFITSLPPSWAI